MSTVAMGFGFLQKHPGIEVFWINDGEREIGQFCGLPGRHLPQKYYRAHQSHRERWRHLLAMALLPEELAGAFLLQLMAGDGRRYPNFLVERVGAVRRSVV